MIPFYEYFILLRNACLSLDSEVLMAALGVYCWAASKNVLCDDWNTIRYVMMGIQCISFVLSRHEPSNNNWSCLWRFSVYSNHYHMHCVYGPKVSS